MNLMFLLELMANEIHWKVCTKKKLNLFEKKLKMFYLIFLINYYLGFKRKEFRGRLAIAITANFINKHTEAEARVEEISGVAFIFNQKFFKDLYRDTGIDLENIVYYKDETHYFVMTAKKHSLIDKGVILNVCMLKIIKIEIVNIINIHFNEL